MTDKEKKQRAIDVELMIDTPGWKNWMEPEIRDIMERSSNINALDENDIERSYWKTKIRRDVYRGFLSKINEWVNLPKGETNGKK